MVTDDQHFKQQLAIQILLFKDINHLVIFYNSNNKEDDKMTKFNSYSKYNTGKLTGKHSLKDGKC